LTFRVKELPNLPEIIEGIRRGYNINTNAIVIISQPIFQAAFEGIKFIGAPGNLDKVNFSLANGIPSRTNETDSLRVPKV
jgi:hypothetical protein